MMPELNPDDFARISTLFVPETITALAISPDGKHLAVAAGDKVHIHRFPVGAATASSLTAADVPRLVTLYMPEKISALLFSPDGCLLTAAAADKLHIFRVPEPQKPKPL